MNIIFVVHQAKIYLSSGLFSFYQGMVRIMKMSFCKRNIYFEISATLPTSQESFRFWDKNYVVFWLEQAYSQPATDCGLIEGKLSTETVVPRSISFNDTAIVRNFYAKKFHPWCKSKKLSKDLPPTWWKFEYDHFWL